ncbi:MAG: hypothetical protein AAF385_17720 [Pseudomonadota bacterium]
MTQPYALPIGDITKAEIQAARKKIQSQLEPFCRCFAETWIQSKDQYHQKGMAIETQVNAVLATVVSDGTCTLPDFTKP